MCQILFLVPREISMLVFPSCCPAVIQGRRRVARLALQRTAYFRADGGGAGSGSGEASGSGELRPRLGVQVWARV